MPYRRRPDLTPERRLRMEEELVFFKKISDEALLDLYVHISRCCEAGWTSREIAELYGISFKTAARWKGWGDQERERRRGGDTERSGEHEQVG